MASVKSRLTQHLVALLSVYMYLLNDCSGPAADQQLMLDIGEHV